MKSEEADPALSNKEENIEHNDNCDLDSDNYSIFFRSPNESIKHNFTLQNKEILQLDNTLPSTSIKNMPIVCSYADMEFKFSPEIFKHFHENLLSCGPHFGYPNLTQEGRTCLMNWVTSRYYKDAQFEWYVGSLNILAFFYSVLEKLTKEEDEVLIFTPTYYRFMHSLKGCKRTIVEQEFGLRETAKGKEIFIDFETLKQTFDTKSIKLMIFINPANPSGRIFTKEELTKLKNILIEHKCQIFVDEIYADSVIETEQFTSLLSFEDLHPYLILASSFGKAYNCSGNSFAYSFIPNNETRKCFAEYVNDAALFPSMLSLKLMESCYSSVGDIWRRKTAKYIERNYNFIKEECKERIPKLQFLTLDSTYLSVADFSKFELKYSEIKQRLESQNIFATYFDLCYNERDSESITLVRINLAMNYEVIKELVNRLEKVF